MNDQKLSTETHNYDGKIGPIYHQIMIKQPNELTFEQSIDIIEHWFIESRLASNQSIRNTINLFKIDRNGNYDQINQIRVEDLLPKVIDIVRNFEPDGINLFLQNLAEISELGSCPQGRITRLLQFYIPFLT